MAIYLSPAESYQCPQCPHYKVANELVAVCESCGLGRTIVPPSQSDQQDYTPRTAEKIKEELWFHKKIYFRFLRKFLRKGSVVLDVGCANGLFLDFLAQHGIRSYGIEPYRRLEPYSERVCIDNISFEAYHTEKKFDCILMIHVLEHLSDPIAALQKCGQLLKPGGLLFLSLPNYGGWWARWAGSGWHWLNPKEHYYHYTVTALTRIMQQQGFVPVICTTHSGSAPSVLNIFLSSRGIFDRGFFSIWPVRSIVYYSAVIVGKIVNVFSDACGRGAEIQLLARLR